MEHIIFFSIITSIYTLFNTLTYKHNTKRFKAILKAHEEELERVYAVVDETMINSLKIVINNCELREDYEGAGKAKDLLDKYESHKIK